MAPPSVPGFVTAGDALANVLRSPGMRDARRAYEGIGLALDDADGANGPARIKHITEALDRSETLTTALKTALRQARQRRRAA